jgi:hypothetical protein
MPIKLSGQKAKGRKAEVTADMARLKGKSRSDLARDDKRGPTSPIGMGSHSAKKMERGRK